MPVDECSACCCQVAVEVVVTCVNTRIDLLSPAASSEDSQQRQIKISFTVFFFFLDFRLERSIDHTENVEAGRSLFTVIVFINKHAPSRDAGHVTSCLWALCSHMTHQQHNTERAHGKTPRTGLCPRSHVGAVCTVWAPTVCEMHH